MKIGQNLNCLVVEVKNEGRVVCLSIDRSEVAASIATERQNWALSNLLPGLVVKARVQKVSSGLGFFCWVGLLSVVEGRRQVKQRWEFIPGKISGWSQLLSSSKSNLLDTSLHCIHLRSHLSSGCDALSIKTSH